MVSISGDKSWEAGVQYVRGLEYHNGRKKFLCLQITWADPRKGPFLGVFGPVQRFSLVMKHMKTPSSCFSSCNFLRYFS